MFNIPTQRLAKVTLTESTDSAVTLSVNPIVIAALSFTPRHLVVRVNAKTASTAGYERDNIQLQFNGDYASNYYVQYLGALGSSSSAGRINAATTYLMGQTAADDANYFAGGECLIPDALSTRTHKSIISLTGGNEDIVQTVAGRWASTAAIVNVTFTCYQSPNQWLAGSTFELCVVDESFNIDQDGDGEQILGSAGTITVGSIGAADGDLVVIGNLRGSNSSDDDAIQIDLNGDSTDSNYGRQHLQGASTTVSAGSNSDNGFGLVSADTATASAFGAFVGQIINYSDGSNDRAMISLSGSHNDSGSSGIRVYSTRWNNTAAVTSVKLSGISTANFITGSMLSTYAVPKNLITRTELASAAATVTFADIPQTYDHLELVVYGRSDEASTAETVYVDMNADTTTANYDRQLLIGTGSTVTAAQSAANRSCGRVPGDNATANVFGGGTTTIYNYTKTDRHKHRLTTNGTTGGYESAQLESTRWESTSAVTSLTVRLNDDSDFMAGTVVTLRGIHSTAPATASDVAALNSIAPADIEAVN